MIRNILAFVLLLYIFCSDYCYGLNIKIIESQSYLSGHKMDLEWQTVLQGMGYISTIVPQQTLDNTLFFSNTDILIISSGVIALPPNRINTIKLFIQQGGNVFLQSEYDCAAYSTNAAFESIVNQLGGFFSWQGIISGTLAPMVVSGSMSSTNNTVTAISDFWYGCKGLINPCGNVEPFLQYQGNYFGFIFYPSDTSYGHLVTTSDQDWVNGGSSPALMENIITNLSNSNFSQSGSNVFSVDSVFLCSNDSLFAGGSWQTTAGTYSDTFPASNGCDSIISKVLSFLPYVSAYQNFSICSDDSVMINGVWENSPGIYYDTLVSSSGCDSIVENTLIVLPGATTQQFISICEGDSVFIAGSWQKDNGIFTDTLSTVNGCDSFVLTGLTINPLSPSNVALSVCNGDSIYLEGNWQSLAGNYYDTLTSINGCDSIVTTTLSLFPDNFSYLSYSICSGDSMYVQGSWQKDAGVYYDTLIGENGCDSILMSNVVVLNGTSYDKNLSICEGDSIFLGNGWQRSEGFYSDTLSGMNGCDSIVRSELKLDLLPLAEIANDFDTVCEGEQVSLSASGGLDFLWSSGETSQTISPSVSSKTTFFVTVSNLCGYAVDSVEIDQFQTVANAGDDISITPGESVQLTATGGVSYLWSTGESTAVISVFPSATTMYYVSITDKHNCARTDSVNVMVDELVSLYIPSCFTPNGDEKNEIFFVEGNGIKKINLKIFDRWGKKIFEINDISTGWDGKYKGKLLSPAVFAYTLSVEFADEKTINKIGRIILLR